MTNPLADAIRAKLDRFVESGKRDDALLAVLDKCEQLRSMRVGPNDEPVGQEIAAEFEQTIARALGITD